MKKSLHELKDEMRAVARGEPQPLTPLGMDYNGFMYAVERVVAWVEQGGNPRTCKYWSDIEREVKEWRVWLDENTVTF
jgi:hypothetical protein